MPGSEHEASLNSKGSLSYEVLCQVTFAGTPILKGEYPRILPLTAFNDADARSKVERFIGNRNRSDDGERWHLLEVRPVRSSKHC